MRLPTETHHSSSLPQPLQTVPRLTWWGATGSLDRGLRPSNGVVAMAAAAAMAEEAARGSTGSSGLCSCFTMTEHSLCPNTHAPCSTSEGREQDPGSGDSQGRGLSAPPTCWELLWTALKRDARGYQEAGRTGQRGVLVRWEAEVGRGQKRWGQHLHSAAYSMGLDDRPRPFLTGCVTLGKLPNLSEPQLRHL